MSCNCNPFRRMVDARNAQVNPKPAKPVVKKIKKKEQKKDEDNRQS